MCKGNITTHINTIIPWMNKLINISAERNMNGGKDSLRKVISGLVHVQFGSGETDEFNSQKSSWSLELSFCGTYLVSVLVLFYVLCWYHGLL